MKKRTDTSNLYKISLAIILFVGFTMPRIKSDSGIDFGFRKCFYTPGLFSRSGADFIKGFLFEFPIAAARWIYDTGMLPLIAVLVLMVGVSFIRNMRNMNNETE